MKASFHISIPLFCKFLYYCCLILKESSMFSISGLHFLDDCQQILIVIFQILVLYFQNALDIFKSSSNLLLYITLAPQSFILWYYLSWLIIFHYFRPGKLLWSLINILNFIIVYAFKLTFFFIFPIIIRTCFISWRLFFILLDHRPESCMLFSIIQNIRLWLWTLKIL